MKKVSPIVAKPIVSAFLVGFTSMETTEGRLAMTDDAKQKKRSKGFEKRDYHLITMSEIHQKLGTFSWYKPRWTGKIAVVTEVSAYKLFIQGAQMIKLTVITIKPYFAIYTNAFVLLCLFSWMVSPTSAARKARE